VIAGYVDAQNERNEFLKRENAKLDKEIEEIRKLRDDIQALLARKQIIESLQNDRARAVELLDQLVKQTPDGVYLKTLKQDGLKVNVTGYAQSNARVSTLMRNLQSSPVIVNNQSSPQLVEIKASEVNKKRLSEFSLNFLLKPPVAEEPEGKKPAGNKG
jgi:type IV pilus assembly protein PilN